jgi:hypothetical protein
MFVKIKYLLIYIYNEWVKFFTWVRGDFKRHIKFVFFSAGLFYLLRITYVYIYVDSPNWFFITARFAIGLAVVLTVIHFKRYWLVSVRRNFIQKYIYNVDLAEDNDRKLELIRAKASKQFNIDVDKLDKQYYKLTLALYFSSLWTICCGVAASPFLPFAATLQFIIWCIRRYIKDQYKYVLRYVEISPEEDVVLPRWRQRLVDLTTPEHLWRGVWESLQGVIDSAGGKPPVPPSEVPVPNSPQNLLQWRGRIHLATAAKKSLIVATALASAGVRLLL